MKRATLLFALLCCVACGGGLVDHDGVDLNALTGSACGGTCPSPQNATGVCNADTKTCDFTCDSGFFRCASQGACCPATALAAGGETSCAVVDGTVQCWGSNDSGQLGFSPTGAMWSGKPVEVPGIAAASAVAVGLRHACAIVGVNGDVWCWGANDSGQLADVTGPGPGQVTGVSHAIALALGDRHSCAEIDTGTSKSVVCWGANDAGQLGRGTTSASELPGAPVTGLDAVASLSAGAAFSCAAASSNNFPNLYCWGDNSSGQFGNGSGTPTNPPTSSPTPSVVSGVGTASVLACGASHACAIGSNFSCWGNDDSGQVGDGKSGPGVTAKVTGVSAVQSPVAVTAGLGHTCALSSNGDTSCWGANAFGQLGTGNTLGQTRPAAVSTLSGPSRIAGIQRIAAGSRHTCAQATTGAVYCWGNNSNSQAGAPRGGTILTPRLIDGR
jgi:Regulator of chromosome condensation (RCC1) repeat